MFMYRLHSPEGDDLGEATYAQVIQPGERSSPAATSASRFSPPSRSRRRTSRRSSGCGGGRAEAPRDARTPDHLRRHSDSRLGDRSDTKGCAGHQAGLAPAAALTRAVWSRRGGRVAIRRPRFLRKSAAGSRECRATRSDREGGPVQEDLAVDDATRAAGVFLHCGEPQRLGAGRLGLAAPPSSARSARAYAQRQKAKRLAPFRTRPLRR